jgi:hypothetical protein
MNSRQKTIVIVAANRRSRRPIGPEAVPGRPQDAGLGRLASPLSVKPTFPGSFDDSATE